MQPSNVQMCQQIHKEILTPMSPERKTAFFSLTVNRVLYSNSSGPLLTPSAFFLETGGGGNGGEMRYKDQKQQICTKVL